MVLSRFFDTLIGFELHQLNVALQHCLSYCSLLYIVDTKVIYSFCVGVACDAAEQGYSDAQTSPFGPWKSHAFKVNLRSQVLYAR